MSVAHPQGESFSDRMDRHFALRHAYSQGWRYGLVCGVLFGVCSSGCALWLARTVLQAWGH